MQSAADIKAIVRVPQYLTSWSEEEEEKEEEEEEEEDILAMTFTHCWLQETRLNCVNRLREQFSEVANRLIASALHRTRHSTEVW